MANTVTFAKPENMGDGESSTEVLLNGDGVAQIYKHSRPRGRAIFGTIAADGEYVADSYEVEFLADPYTGDRFFDVDEYGNARSALAAAKRYAKAVLAGQKEAV